MSRSHRKTPIIGFTSAQSDKPFKVAEHRRERRSARATLAKIQDGDDGRLHSKVFGDPWKSDKDGKYYFASDARMMRK